jgi:predicted metal-dependent phosphoesterase TrpH
MTPKERQMWANVAAHIAEVMGNLSKGYDERRFNEDLAELEQLVNEIKQLQTEQVKPGDRAAQEAERESTSTSNYAK